jgi:hypothetical protein
MTNQLVQDTPTTTQTTASAPQARATEFQPVGSGAETTSAASLLVAAYLLMWAILVGFLFLSWRRQGHVENRIAELEKALAAGGAKDDARN